jgi:hypothetical protein
MAARRSMAVLGSAKEQTLREMTIAATENLRLNGKSGSNPASALTV